ncbi:MAG: transcription termination/antitermination protein NusA [Lachnospiraceae bacterium]|nr:transcription termination/antitermination protein NusA [Lachnospiraceae bacterium]
MSEIMDALNEIEKEKGIDKEVLMETIEKAIVDAYKRDKNNDIEMQVVMDRETGAFSAYVERRVVEKVENPSTEISLEEARMIDPNYDVDDVVKTELQPKNFGRISAQNARNVIVQKIKEEERKSIFNHFQCKEKDVVTGVVQRYIGKNVCISLDDKTDAILTENEQIPGETFYPTERVKLYIVEVKENNKGPRILVSRTHKDLVKRLFEKEVAEVADGVVEIKNISREAGSRSKIAVYSNDSNVDPVGACVGLNGARVNAIVDDLHGEKIDIITWNENPAIYIKNALSPSSVVSVTVDLDEKTARVVVPDNQLSLAIGKEGQNARLAARLTGYKIDIKSESQVEDYEDDSELEEDGYEEYDETGDGYDENEEGYEDADVEESDVEDTDAEDTESEESEEEESETTEDEE